MPLLQIAPSKTDRERLPVVSPELAEVLTAIIFWVRGGKAALPLTPRYDWRERLTSAPMPYLFQRRIGPYHRVIPDRHVRALLEHAVEHAGIVDESGQPLRYTTHDFRRIFAIEAIAMGLSLPILAKLMGHENVAVTEGYVAIYPEDGIRHHRAFISRRRSLRPSAEYRQPTDAEWEEFLAHFERRKTGPGICGRAYGTACQREHAPLTELVPRSRPAFSHQSKGVASFCAWSNRSQVVSFPGWSCPGRVAWLPRVRSGSRTAPPATRLSSPRMTFEGSLSEAEREGWLGEVEGLKVSLAGAEDKLAQIDATLSRRATPSKSACPPSPTSPAAPRRLAELAQPWRDDGTRCCG